MNKTIKLHSYRNNDPITYRNRQHYDSRTRKIARSLDLYTFECNARPYSDKCHHCQKDHEAGHSDCQIPDAPFYVVSNDTFMSGWGPLGKNVTDVCVVPCATSAEAYTVEEYVSKRGDQKYVRIVTTKPRSNARRHLSLLIAWRYNALNLDEPRPAERRQA